MRRSKLVGLADAASHVLSGMRVAIGGLAVNQHPMALTRELVRQSRHELTIVGCLNGLETDLLIGAGCVRRVETAYVGLEEFGLAPNFRRAVEQGMLEVHEFSELLAFDRFRASQDGWTFALSSALAGTDILKHNDQVREVVCPFTGRIYHAVPPAEPDVVLVHAPVADEFGNVLVAERALLPQNLDLAMTRSCDTVIVSVERIVGHDAIRRAAYRNQIPAFRTTCVVEAPMGAHPCSMQSYYDVDRVHFARYVDAARTEHSFLEYLRRYVFEPVDHGGYLGLIGAEGWAASEANVGGGHDA